MTTKKLALALLSCLLYQCESKKPVKVYEDFAIDQNIVFSKSTVVFKNKVECEKFFRQLDDYPLEMAISIGAAFYVDQNTRALVIEQAEDTLRLRITGGPKNGFSGWTSKLYVSKVFPVLPTRGVVFPENVNIACRLTSRSS